MIDFKEWLVESTKEVNGWQFVFSAHAFDRLRQRTAATFDDESTILQNISGKIHGIYAFLISIYQNLIFILR